MMEIETKTKTSEEFIWAQISGSKPLKINPDFEFQVKFFHGRYNNKNWICKLKPGLFITLLDVTPLGDIMNIIESREDCLRFVFFLSGKGYLDHNLIDRRMKCDFNDGLLHHSFLSFSPEIEGRVLIAAKHRLRIFTVHITPARLMEYFNGQFNMGPYALRDIIAGSEQFSFFHSARLSRQMHIVIHQILNCPYHGPMKRLFIEGKAFELILYKMDQIIQSESANQGSFEISKIEYERTKTAARILVRNMENPPGLFELAKLLGTTHTRLNIGFKKIYGTTTFGFLRQIRLEKAKQLLEQRDLNITQIVYEVGYSSIPSFSKAFSDYFGNSPAVFLKKRF